MFNSSDISDHVSHPSTSTERDKHHHTFINEIFDRLSQFGTETVSDEKILLETMRKYFRLGSIDLLSTITTYLARTRHLMSILSNNYQSNLGSLQTPSSCTRETRISRDNYQSRLERRVDSIRFW